VEEAELKGLSAEHRREVAVWLEQNSPSFPEPVRAFLALHQRYLSTTGDLRKAFDSTCRELRRALGITPSSEKRPSGSPNAGVPGTQGKDSGSPKTEREKLEEQLERTERLGDWHRHLDERHQGRAKRLREKIEKMQTDPSYVDPITEDTPLEDIELTAEQEAEAKAAGAAFVQHILMGNGTDPVLKSVNETLMPGGAVLADTDRVYIPAVVPPEMEGAKVVKELIEERVRYDFSVAVTRLDLEVEKKVVVTAKGERSVIAASTSEYGPPGFRVTWSALATLAVMVAQFALPLNRLGTMFSTAGKRFTAGGLGRMLHYIAERLLPIYLHLVKELAQSEILSGDDTSCRVLEVSRHLAKSAQQPSSRDEPPWAGYRSPGAAEHQVRRCEELKRARLQRRADGDREAKRTSAETPPLGALIGRTLTFESLRRNGDGAKQSLNTTVVSGRSVAADPRSLIVLYRSHLGSFGNLVEDLLRLRNPAAKDVILQGDLSTTNLVADPLLCKRFKIRVVGCSAHARRPFANYEHEDPLPCSHILHLFKGLAIHEERLDVHGRNRENVLAVRQNESRRCWSGILKLATEMAEKHSPATKLGTGARYIIKHFDKLTAYLDDPRLEPTNNLRERMLRTEKLIEGSSMFRVSLEGRFVLDVIRTVLQTAVAAGVPVHEYLVSVLRAEDDVAKHPDRFTPRAWMAALSKTAEVITAPIAPQS
jgi:hypothetical protein